MARMVVDGMRSLIAGLEDMAEQTPQLRNDILKAEADVIEPIIRAGVSAADLVDTGLLQRSIKQSSSVSWGVPVIRIGPTGEHHRYNPSSGKSGIVRAGHLGYIYEYGGPYRNIRARHWMSNALEKAKGPAYEAADAVYDQFIKKHNF